MKRGCSHTACRMMSGGNCQFRSTPAADKAGTIVLIAFGMLAAFMLHVAFG